MKNKIAIIIAGGLGDNITYAARLPSLLRSEKVEKADFFVLNTHNNVTYMIVDYLELSPYVDKVFIDTNPDGKDYKKIVNWRPDDAPLPYEVEPVHMCYHKDEDVEWAAEILEKYVNPIIIYPYTLGSSQWAKSEKYVRSPKEAWWKELFKEVKERGGTPIVLGGEDERINWQSHDVVPLYTSKDDFTRNIPLIINSNGYIGIASWPWEVSHYCGHVDTCVLWLYNHMWCDRHKSKDVSRLHIFKTLPDREEIYKHLRYLE